MRRVGFAALLFVASIANATAPHVYLAIGGDPPTQELWLERAAPLPPLKLNGPLQHVQQGAVNSFAVSHDGTRVVYTANASATHPLDYNLYAVPIAGPPVHQISGALTFDYDVATRVLFTADDARVLYRVGRSSTGPWDLYSARWSMTQCCGEKISQDHLPMGRMVEANFDLYARDLVKFSSDVESDEVFVWYVVPVAGGALPRPWILFIDGFNSGTTARWSR